MNKETISEYYLERYALGELPDEETEEIGRMAVTDPELQEALDEIESSNQNILVLYPPLTVKAGLLTRLDDRPNKLFPLKRVLFISSAVATFLILILLFPLFKQESRIIYPNAEQDVTLVK